MIAASIGDSAGRRACPVDEEAVGSFVGVDPESAETRHERGDPIGLLVAELASAADADLPPMCGEGGNRRQLVDQARDLAWRDLDGASSIRFTRSTIPTPPP